MAKGPISNPEDLSSYEIDEKILNQIGPWTELEAFYPVSGGQVVSLDALQVYLEQLISESQPEIDPDDLEELILKRLKWRSRNRYLVHPDLELHDPLKIFLHQAMKLRHHFLD
jgi:hypothetical protein